MHSLHVTTTRLIYLCAVLLNIECIDEKVIVPCFRRNVKVEIAQFDNRISMKYINCSRLLNQQRFTITFEIERRWRRLDQLLELNMVVTLFAGPCSSSTATLNIGRTFPAVYGTLDGSNPSSVVSSHLPWNEQSVQGTISYEYGGDKANMAQLISALINVVIRYGREEFIKGIYLVKFNN